MVGRPRGKVQPEEAVVGLRLEFCASFCKKSKRLRCEWYSEAGIKQALMFVRTRVAVRSYGGERVVKYILW